MINFSTHTLSNGLKVLLHSDKSSELVAINILYDVGAKDEHHEHTGFAHLFEHLMFGGSANIKNYDSELQKVGGENNAYTTNDYTNYYIQLPKQNLETALWLESDRMAKLAFSQPKLDIQKKVVCEEFKEHYLNKPYGDVWHLLKEMCYKQHPYQWLTIGKNLSHIENVTLKEVKDFFKKHYNPSNAILSIAGNIDETHTLNLVNKWFGTIVAGKKYNRSLSKEATQTEARFLEVYRDVPTNAFYKCWHICNRQSEEYYVLDMISDILGNGQSSRLHLKLVKEKKLFTFINCYHSDCIDEGLFIIEGKLNEGVEYQHVELELEAELNKIKTELVEENELTKIRNQNLTNIEFEKISLLNRANQIAYYELLGNANLINTEFEKYNTVTAQAIKDYANNFLVPQNCNTLYYRKK